MKKLIKHPIIIAIILLLTVFLGSIAVGKFVQSSTISLKIDGYFYNIFANGFHSHFLDILVWPINNNFIHIGGSSMPSYFIVILGLYLFYVFVFKRKVFVWSIVSLLISGIIIGLILIVDSHFIFRQRPYITLPNHLTESFKNALKGWNSFPSGHVRDTAIYSVIMAFYVPVLTLPLIIFTLFVGWSRLYVGAHFPSDILVGLLMGVIIGKVVLIFTKQLQEFFGKWRSRNDKKVKQD